MMATASDRYSKQDSFEMGKTTKEFELCMGNFSTEFSRQINKAKAAHPKDFKAGYNSVKSCPDNDPAPTPQTSASNAKSKQQPNNKMKQAAKIYIEKECRSTPQLCKSKRKGALSKTQMIGILSKADNQDQFPEYIEGFYCKNTGGCEMGDWIDF